MNLKPKKLVEVGEKCDSEVGKFFIQIRLEVMTNLNDTAEFESTVH